MKVVLALCALVAVVVCRPEETYSTRYDNFDVPALISNIRLLESYGKCFVGKGPCTPEGADFKKTMPEAVKTNCLKCSPKQKELIRTVVIAMQTKLPEIWAELVKKEDPEGLYKANFDAFINATN